MIVEILKAVFSVIVILIVGIAAYSFVEGLASQKDTQGVVNYLIQYINGIETLFTNMLTEINTHAKLVIMAAVLLFLVILIYKKLDSYRSTL